MENAAASLGTQLLPAATAAIGVFADLVHTFSNLDEGIKTSILSVGGIAGGLAALGLVIPPLISGIVSLRAALTLLAAHPIGIAISVLSIALVGLVGLMKNLNKESADAASEGMSRLTSSMGELQASAGRAGHTLSDADAALIALTEQSMEMRDAVDGTREGLRLFNNELKPQFVDEA